jgi:hypothetical protein
VRTTSLRLPALLLACALPACGSDPDTTTSTDSSGTGTTTTTGENTEPATGVTGTGEPGTTGEPDSTGSTGTTGDSTGGTVTTGEPGSTGTGSTTDTSTGEVDTGDTSTGGTDGLGQLAQDIRMSLEVAVDGVYYLSESDYPWTVFAIADVTAVTELNVKDVIADVYVPHGDPPLADRAVEVRTLAQLMDPLTVMQDWWGPDEVKRAEDYQAIRDVLEGQLTNVQVFRLGEEFGGILMGAIDLFVIGETTDGDLVGMFTIAVET